MKSVVYDTQHVSISLTPNETRLLNYIYKEYKKYVKKSMLNISIFNFDLTKSILYDTQQKLSLYVHNCFMENQFKFSEHRRTILHTVLKMHKQ